MSYADLLCQEVMWKKINTRTSAASSSLYQRLYDKEVECKKEIWIPGEKTKIGSVTTLYNSYNDQSNGYRVWVHGSFITTPKQNVSSVSGYYLNFYVVNTETNEEIAANQTNLTGMRLIEGTDYSVDLTNSSLQLKNAHPFSTFDLYYKFEGYKDAGTYDENPHISISSIQLGGFYDYTYLVEDYDKPSHPIGLVDVEV